MKLTAKAIDLAQPADKEYMLSDGDKLYLRVHPSGGKRWLFNSVSRAGGSSSRWGRTLKSLWPQLAI